MDKFGSVIAWVDLHDKKKETNADGVNTTGMD
jgi:hypothetical protein